MLFQCCFAPFYTVFVLTMMNLTGCTNPVATNYNETFTMIPRADRFPADPRDCAVVDCSTDEQATCHANATCGVVGVDPVCACGSGWLGNGTLCDLIVLGCTSATAMNYVAAANIDDGSCAFRVDGCTVEASLNYNAAATHDDASCIPDVLGCMETDAVTYNPSANKDDGSCVAVQHFCECECDCKTNVSVIPLWEEPALLAATPAVTFFDYIHISGETQVLTSATEDQMRQAVMNILANQDATPANAGSTEFTSANYSQSIAFTMRVAYDDSVIWNPLVRDFTEEVSTALRSVFSVDASGLNMTVLDSTSDGSFDVTVTVESTAILWEIFGAVDFNTTLANELSSVAMETMCSTTLGGTNVYTNATNATIREVTTGHAWVACNGACVPRGTCDYQSSTDDASRTALDGLEVSIVSTSGKTSLTYTIVREARPIIDNALAIANNYSLGLADESIIVQAFATVGITVPSIFIYDSARPFALKTCVGSSPCTYSAIGSCAAVDLDACAAANIGTADDTVDQASCLAASAACTGTATAVAATCGVGNDDAGTACAVNTAGDACEVADGACGFVTGYTPVCDLFIETDVSATCPAGCTSTSACTYTAQDSGNGIVESCAAADLSVCAAVDVDVDQQAAGVDGACATCPKVTCEAAGACAYATLAPCAAAEISNCSLADIRTMTCTGTATPVAATCGDGNDAAGAACAVDQGGVACEVADGTCSFVAGHTPICDWDDTTDSRGDCASGCTTEVAGAASDQASCEAVGECIYIPADSAAGIFESCVATDFATCESVAPTASEAVCLSSGECGYDKLMPCAASDIAVCAAVDTTGTDAAADETACEAAARCTYIAEDVGNGVAELCKATHDFVCSSPDATQFTCTGAGACTYTALVDQGVTVYLVDRIDPLATVSTTYLPLSLMMWLRMRDPASAAELVAVEAAVQDEIADVLQVNESRIVVASQGVNFLPVRA